MTPPRSTSRLGALIRMARPVNCAMMGAAVIVGEIAILAGVPSPIQMALGFAVASLLTASAMIINDIVDLEIDRVNAPERPLPSGLVSKRTAALTATVAGALGVAASVPLSYYAIAVAALTFACSYFYNTRGKQTGLLGNSMVAFCVAMPFLFGGIVVVGYIDVLVAVFFLLAFLANIGREVTKGIADVEGDKLKNIRTVALAKGLRFAAGVAAFFYILPVLLTPLPYIFGRIGIAYVIIVIAVDIGFCYSAISILRRQDKANALKVKTQARYWMILALVAFLLGGLI